VGRRLTASRRSTTRGSSVPATSTG
jgi:hypothetical protein